MSQQEGPWCSSSLVRKKTGQHSARRMGSCGGWNTQPLLEYVTDVKSWWKVRWDEACWGHSNEHRRSQPSFLTRTVSVMWWERQQGCTELSQEEITMQRADIAWEVEKCRGKADVGVKSWEACCSCFLSWESSVIVHMMIGKSWYRWSNCSYWK